ncbi:MAG: glycosyltransferase family 4 protein [Gammaproteobacteria bacterium]
MKVLVFAQQLVIGGTTINAIELSAALRDFYGHEVVLFASPGPLVRTAKEKGLHYIPAPEISFHPSTAKIRALREVIKQERPDVIHAWEWSQCLDAYYGAYLTLGIPLVVTDMLMDVNRVLPKLPLTTFGIPNLVGKAKTLGRKHVELLLPPVDVKLNAPGIVDRAPFVAKYGIDTGNLTLVTVSRLVPYLKYDSLIRSIDAIRTIGGTIPLQFVIVGGGPSEPDIAKKAACVNEALGRQAIIMTGELTDPRPAYAAADIVIGMGGSALRGMAFAKPVIVVGAGGFSKPFRPETADEFLYNGIYGYGNGSPNNEQIVEDILSFVRDINKLPDIGRFSRDFVVRHFSLETVTAHLHNYLTAAINQRPGFSMILTDAIRTSAVYVRDRVFMWRSILQGQNVEWVDDIIK